MLSSLRRNDESENAPERASVILVDVFGTMNDCIQRARGVVVSHLLSMREALGSVPSGSILHRLDIASDYFVRA